MNTELGKMQKMIFKKNKLPFKKKMAEKNESNNCSSCVIC